MQLNETENMAIKFNNEVRKTFGERVDDFCILDVVDDPNHRAFSVEFNAYDYYPIIFNYDMGRIGFNICYGVKRIGLKSSQKWWDEVDFDIFFKELKEELEIRIPDKFLKARGWL